MCSMASPSWLFSQGVLADTGGWCWPPSARQSHPFASNATLARNFQNYYYNFSWNYLECMSIANVVMVNSALGQKS